MKLKTENLFPHFRDDPNVDWFPTGYLTGHDYPEILSYLEQLQVSADFDGSLTHDLQLTADPASLHALVVEDLVEGVFDGS